MLAEFKDSFTTPPSLPLQSPLLLLLLLLYFAYLIFVRYELKISLASSCLRLSCITELLLVFIQYFWGCPYNLFSSPLAHGLSSKQQIQFSFSCYFVRLQPMKFSCSERLYIWSWGYITIHHVVTLDQVVLVSLAFSQVFVLLMLLLKTTVN